MDTRILYQLSPQVIELVAQIEDFADLELAVNERPGGPSHQISWDQAVIYFNDLSAICPHGMLHELLHIQRNWIHKIPMLVTKDLCDPITHGVADIDNRLEHLVIVPNEAKYGFEPFQKWNDLAEIRWHSEFGHLGVSDRRSALLMEWLSVKRLVTKNSVTERAITVLRSYGLLEEAECFADTIIHNLENKPEATALTVDITGIPRERIHLATLLVQEREPSFSPVPV